MNKILLIGNIGRDAEGASTKSGLSVSKFSLAVTKKYKGQSSTEWFSCVLFGTRAEALGQYLKKGTQVYVEGELKSSKYTGKDGIEKTRYDVLVNDIQLLSQKQEQSAPRVSTTHNFDKPAKVSAESPFELGQFSFDDSIPF
jgi:single-strand DNA-binding protein